MGYRFKRKVMLSLLLPLAVWGQFNGIKIMVNPGHGGHDADDRFIAQTGYWESDGNLTKGLYLRDLLEARGAAVIMSRTQNRTIDDLPLSQISAIANSNNVDYFQSIHSNGFEGTANRTSVFWEELNNGQPDFPEAKRMAEILAAKIFEVNYTTSTHDRGDRSFLGFTLGVLRDLNMPGTLTEGSFHDYVPESYRLLNFDYRRHEAVAILRGMLEYFNLPPLEYGAIAGLARNSYDEVPWNYTGGNSSDMYRPINNILASLYQDTVLLRTYHGDFNNNGYFVFDSIAPGNYILTLDYGYFTTDTLQVSIIANNTSFVEVFPVATLQTPPRVFGTLPENGQTGLNTYNSIEIVFSRSMQRDSTQAAFSIIPATAGEFYWKQNGQVLVFNPLQAFIPQTEYRLTISTQAQNTSNIPMEKAYNFMFTTADDHIYPQISSTFPALHDSITVFENIEVIFDQDMQRQSVEQAFTIQPPLNGAFNWISDRHFIFRPDSLSIGTVYSVTITGQALNTFSVGLASDYVFDFKTYNRDALNIIKWYPGAGDTGISTLVSFYLQFDGILDASTVLAHIALEDEDHTRLEMDSYKLDQRNGASLLRFDSREELQRNKLYRIHISPGITDMDGLLLKDSLTFSFTTAVEKYNSGMLMDDFSYDTGWQEPPWGPSTQFMDRDNSFFGLSFVEKISAPSSAIINYIFNTDSLGICQVFREEGYSLSLKDSSRFGLWVYGDYSFNTLELWYDSANEVNETLEITTLDFSGWKLITFPSYLFNTPDISLHSIVVKQQAGAYPQGRIFIDDIQSDVITALAAKDYKSQLSSYKLWQNRPNPFNNTTVISYQLSGAGEVHLSIYNILGQKVETLVSTYQPAGIYDVHWDAAGVASGVYFYRLEMGGVIIRTQKMVVIK